MTSSTLFGTFRLPFVIGVDGSLFGTSEPTRINGVDCRVVMPPLKWFEDRVYVVRPSRRTLAKPPADPDDPDEAMAWGEVRSYNPTRREVNKGEVHQVVLRATRLPSEAFTYSEYLYGRGAPEGPTVNALFAGVHEWAQTLGEWIEVFTGQDAQRDAPLHRVTQRGGGLTLWVHEGRTHSLPARPNVFVIRERSGEALDRATWRRVLRCAGKQLVVPMEHRLVIDARAALGRGQIRRAAIDAGTAAEIALRRVLDGELAPIADPVRSRLANHRWMLGGLAKITAGMTGATQQAMDNLMKCRNDSVHGAGTPDRD